MQVSGKSDHKCRLYRINKKKTNGGRRKPRHDICSTSFQPVELTMVSSKRETLSHSIAGKKSQGSNHNTLVLKSCTLKTQPHSLGRYLDQDSMFHKHCTKTVHLTLSQILDSSKLKKFADNNLRFDKNGRKFSKWVENTVGKGEITCYDQFHLFPQCFQKTCTADM